MAGKSACASARSQVGLVSCLRSSRPMPASTVHSSPRWRNSRQKAKAERASILPATRAPEPRCGRGFHFLSSERTVVLAPGPPEDAGLLAPPGTAKSPAPTPRSRRTSAPGTARCYSGSPLWLRAGHISEKAPILFNLKPVRREAIPSSGSGDELTGAWPDILDLGNLTSRAYHLARPGSCRHLGHAPLKVEVSRHQRITSLVR